MPVDSAIVTELESLKERIGWGWNEVGKKMGWGPPHIAKFRTLRLELPPGFLEYFRAVAEAIEAVPVPELRKPSVLGVPTPVEAMRQFDPVADKLRAAGFEPSPQRQEVHAMLLPDIAEKLAAEYRALQSPEAESEQADMTGEERAGAIWMIGKVAERLGVAEAVRGLVGARPLPPDAAPAPRAMMPQRMPFS